LSDSAKILGAKTAALFGANEAVSTLNVVNKLSYSMDAQNQTLAGEIWSRKKKVTYGDWRDEYGNRVSGMTNRNNPDEILLSDALLGGGREGSIKLAAIAAHEGDHTYGNHIEALAYAQSLATYLELSSVFGTESDNTFATAMALKMFDPKNWKENTGDVDYCDDLNKFGSNLWDFMSITYSEFGKQYPGVSTALAAYIAANGQQGIENIPSTKISLGIENPLLGKSPYFPGQGDGASFEAGGIFKNSENKVMSIIGSILFSGGTYTQISGERSFILDIGAALINPGFGVKLLVDDYISLNADFSVTGLFNQERTFNAGVFIKLIPQQRGGKK
jgi:hypothetical protein